MRPRSSLASLPLPRNIVFTTAGATPPGDACPTGSSLEIRTGKLPAAALPCIGQHARGEGHRAADGTTWTAGADEKRPAPPVTFSIGFDPPELHQPIPRPRAKS